MSSAQKETDKLFASAPAEVNSHSAKAPMKTNLFAKKREPHRSSALPNSAAVDGSKAEADELMFAPTTSQFKVEDKTNANSEVVSGLFATQAVQRSSNLGQGKRNLGQDFLSRVNQNNLQEKEKQQVDSKGENCDGNSGAGKRNSVLANIAMFQSNIDSNKGISIQNKKDTVSSSRLCGLC